MTFSISPRLRLLTFGVMACAMLLSTTVQADVRVPGFYGDHMVLQQQKPIRLRGWADASEKITVTLGENSVTATANEDGTWTVELPAMTASKQPHVLEFKGNNTIQIKDVLIGEVWLCSGQSNMEWSVRKSSNATKEAAAANYPLIRHVKINRTISGTAVDDAKNKWQTCSPATAINFTACGYYMARKLVQELDVPIGLIHSSWGGTRVDSWIAPIGFKRIEALQDIYKTVQARSPDSPEYQQGMNTYLKAVEKWQLDARSALDKTRVAPPLPAYPPGVGPVKSQHTAGVLYNGMIHPLVGFPIRGAIWYQGESNHNEGMLYLEKKKALINGWRELWGQGDFPFYYVQIAPFQYSREDPTILPRFWEAQAAVQQLPNTGMVVINDIATLQNIHPPNKQDIGLRLANLALKYDYGKTDIVANSPEFQSLATQGEQLTITFKNTGGGLKTRDEKPPTHFEIVGANSKGFKTATAKIVGDTVVLTSADVKSPVAFRFAWHKLATPNLIGGTGLPVGAVRGGEAP